MNSITQARFSTAIKEEMRHEKSIMQAILNVCEKFGVEPDRCKKYLDDSVRQKLEAEAVALNLVRKTNSSEVL